MTHLFFFIIIWSIVPVSFAHSTLICDEDISSQLERSLKLASFQCESVTTGSCRYTECHGKLPNYPKPILVAIPNNAFEFRLHFHGHKLGIFPEYEKNLSSMVKAFGLNQKLCEGKEVSVFPESDGKCATYDQVLNNKAAFEIFFNDIHSATGEHLKNLPFHLSAHSGGGRALARLLQSDIPVDQVTLFDGIYSENQKRSLKDWYQKSAGKLTLATVKGMSPQTYSGQLTKELGLKSDISQTTFQGKTFDVFKSHRLIHFSREAGLEGKTQAHYNILQETW
jgi:hypothetical protein